MKRIFLVGTSRQFSILGIAGLGFFSAVMASPAHSADLLLKTPIAETPGEFRAFISGGAFWTGGDPISYSGIDVEAFAELGRLAAADPTVAPKVGWSAGTGFDYRFAASPWHVNGQFRYGQSSGRGPLFPQSFSDNDTNSNGGPTSEVGTASVSAALKETHWLVDFGGGFDLPFARNAQLNFGIRTARLSSDLTTSSAFSLLELDPLPAHPLDDTTSLTVHESSLATQRSSFLGAGPRVGVEGSVPLGQFSFDYAANAAWLIGNSRINSESVGSLSVASTPIGVGANFSETGITNGSNLSKTVSIYNGDVLVGVSYWFTPAVKMSVNYRLDAYFNGLRTFDANGNVISIDRYYHGPEIALTAKF